MCGICGIIGPDASAMATEAMVVAQAHRGPDGSGQASLAGGHCQLGHNRLSIIDLSHAGDQPMLSSSGNALTFNGEIYNYIELRRELAGYPFRSQTDTEVILAAYEKWGVQAFGRFIGMFAFALWDERRQQLICVRDRFGIKPFLYAHRGGRFLFASEARALLAAGVPGEPDIGAWRDYLANGLLDHDERTFFSGITRLKPGHYLVVGRDGRVEREAAYWSLPEEVAKVADGWRGDTAAACERLRDLVNEAVSLRLRADVPVGVNLSGGLDSSILAATVSAVEPGNSGPRAAFTIGYGDPRYDEADFAAAAVDARRFDRRVHVFRPQDVETDIDDAVESLEAPFGGVATMAYFALHRHIRRAGFKVALEGQGLDEQFGGYGYFRAARLIDLAQEGFRAIRAEISHDRPGYRFWLRHARRIVKGFEGGPVYYDGTSPVDRSCLNPDLVAFADARNPVPESPFPDALRAMLYRDLRHTKLPRVLRMNDLLSMRHGIELREPFLDHRVVAFAFAMPGAMKIARGVSKVLPRIAFRDRLPAAVLDAPKRFVVSPQREWLRGPLQGLVQDVIASRSFRDRGYFDAKTVAAAYTRFLQGGSDNALFVWQWVNCELWHRRFVDGAHRLARQVASA